MWNTSSLLFLLLTITFSATGCVSQLRLTPTSSPTPNPRPGVINTNAPVLDTINGSFRNQISNLEEDMPLSNSEGYVVPTDKELADFADLIMALESKDLIHATNVATANDYTLNYYVDRGDDHAVSYLLRENKPIRKGWGLYAFRVNSTSNIIIEAPHPIYDRGTPSVALDIYRALDARALLIAGAHRDANHDGSADVAHVTGSIFQSIHQALSQEILATSGNAIILQIHGFYASKHKDYPQVVLGFGENAQSEEVALAQRMKDAFSEQGISADLCIGNDLQDLCAETNVQGAATNEGVFIHLELDEKLRKDDKALIRALIKVFAE